MSNVRPIITTTTDEHYKCVFCGSDSTSIVRIGPDPRVKCASCNGTFDGSQSKAAENAGLLESSEESVANAEEPEVHYSQPWVDSGSKRATETVPSTSTNIPRTPAFVFLSKDRKRMQFCARKDVKRTALRWQEVKHDLFELTPKTSNVKVDIQ